MLRSFARWDKLFNPVGKHDQADLVVVFYGRKSQQRTQLGCHLAFELVGGTKPSGSTGIHHDHYRQFPLFPVPLNMWFSRAGSDIPVYRSYVISGLVLPYLLKLHTTALEDTVVGAGQDIVHRPVCVDLDTPYFSNQFSRYHC